MTTETEQRGQSAIFDFLSEELGQEDDFQRIDTHASAVFLMGDTVFKAKRELKYPFLDYSTLDKRGLYCVREVNFNRRSAPELYLGVRPVIRGEDGRISLGERIENPDENTPATYRPPVGEVVEWLVEMRRFDQDKMIDKLAARGETTPELMEELADAVTDLHEKARPQTGAPFADNMRWVVQDNNDGLGAMAPEIFNAATVAQFTERADAQIAALGPALEARSEGGFVRRCHGDLHIGNICMIDDKPRLFDAIEFNDDFTIIDRMYDIAFLLMDLEFRGQGKESNIVLNRYLEKTRDEDGLELLPFYMSQRAAIRAKVTAANVATIEDADKKAEKTALARDYLDLALKLAQPDGPQLLAIGGLSGSGKTTEAKKKAARSPALRPAR